MKRTLAVLVVAIAGCGGADSPSTADFKKEFAPIDAQLKAAGREMATVFQGAGEKSDAELAKEVDSVRDELHEVNGKYADLEPSDEVKDDYEELRTILEGLETDVDNLSGAVSAHDAKRSAAGAKKIIADSVKVKATANSLRRAVGLKPTP